MDRQTLRKYLTAASAAGLTRETPITRDAWQAWVHTTLPATWGGQRSRRMAALAPYHDRIQAALKTNHVTTVWHRLCDDTGLTVSLSTFRRYCATLTVPPQPREVTAWRGQYWSDAAAAQAGAERWCRAVAGQRIHGTTGIPSPGDAAA